MFADRCRWCRRNRKVWRLGSGQDCSTDSMVTSRELMSWMSVGGRTQSHNEQLIDQITVTAAVMSYPAPWPDSGTARWAQEARAAL